VVTSGRQRVKVHWGNVQRRISKPFLVMPDCSQGSISTACHSPRGGHSNKHCTYTAEWCECSLPYFSVFSHSHTRYLSWSQGHRQFSTMVMWSQVVTPVTALSMAHIGVTTLHLYVHGQQGHWQFSTVVMWSQVVTPVTALSMAHTGVTTLCSWSTGSPAI